MPVPHPTLPPPAEPIRKTFDPWNSSTTGHQRADDRLAGSTSWRESRSLKLGHQFRSGNDGGKRVFDTVGAGSLNFGKDGRKENGSWEPGAPGLREKGWRDVSAMMMEGGLVEKGRREEGRRRRRELDFPEVAPAAPSMGKEPAVENKEKPIFAGLTVYINGSTAPMISDHKLKKVLASRGANISIALGRRSVTHVILGKHNDGRGGGAGGGLAGSKIQKEISRIGGKGVKFVSVEWVLESMKVGKRLPEARFESLSIAPKGVKSVYGLFKKGDKAEAAGTANPEAAKGKT